MKHTKQFFIAFLCILFAVNASAAKITKETATKVAKNYFTEVSFSKGMNQSTVISKSFDIKKDGEVVMYAFNFENGGYVIVSGEDQFAPILGYSPDGFYSSENMAEGLEYIIDEFSNMIAFVRTQKVAAEPEYTAKWERYSNDNFMVRGTAAVPMVGPLVALWNQDYPYNYYCPVFPGGPGGRTYAGCVATAMSMIMHYWRWPWQGEGSYSYKPNPCQGVPMPTQSANFGETYYDYNGMYGTPEITADNYLYEPLSLLQYHCGIAVDMAYCIGDGSGTQSTKVPNAMKSYFKYDPSIVHVTRGAYANTAAWADMLMGQLDLAQPVYVSGGSHAYVCDGYDSDGMFHYNFGWSGHQNGYFIADQPAEYGSNLAAVINFIPDRSKGYPVDCNTSYTVPYLKGMIASCGEPGKFYEAGITTTWLLNPESFGNKVDNITINCNSIDLMSGDFLRIYDGSDENAPLLGEFSGSSNFEKVTTTGPTAFMKFTSAESSVGGNGFLVTYEAKPHKYCTSPITFTEAKGSFTDGSEEGYNYSNSTSCRWYISPEGIVDPDTDISLIFTRFDTEETDVVKVYDYDKNLLVATFSGYYSETDLPELIVKTQKIMVTFTSNVYGNASGFAVDFFTTPEEVTELENVNNLKAYPNPATSFLNLSFDTPNSDDLQITLYNVTGQRIYHETLNSFVGSYNKQLDINNFSQGIYLLQVKSSQGAVTKKIVVQ